MKILIYSIILYTSSLFALPLNAHYVNPSDPYTSEWECDYGYKPEFSSGEWYCKSTFIEMHDSMVIDTNHQYLSYEYLFIRIQDHCGESSSTLYVLRDYGSLYATCQDNKVDSIRAYYSNGNKKGIYTYENGTSVTIESWYENGNKDYEKNYVNGKLHGLSTFWYENGNKLKEENYVNDKSHGKYTWWDENGNKLCEHNYVNGKLHGKYTVWHENGNKWREENYVNDKSHGKYTDWDSLGNVTEKGNFVNDKLHGTQYRFYKSGRIKWKIPYINGNIGYRSVIYYEDNSSIYETLYRSKMVNGLCHSYSKMRFSPLASSLIRTNASASEKKMANTLSQWKLEYVGVPKYDITRCLDSY